MLRYQHNVIVQPAAYKGCLLSEGKVEDTDSVDFSKLFSVLKMFLASIILFYIVYVCMLMYLCVCKHACVMDSC